MDDGQLACAKCGQVVNVGRNFANVMGMSDEPWICERCAPTQTPGERENRADSGEDSGSRCAAESDRRRDAPERRPRALDDEVVLYRDGDVLVTTRRLQVGATT